MNGKQNIGAKWNTEKESKLLLEYKVTQFSPTKIFENAL